MQFTNGRERVQASERLRVPVVVVGAVIAASAAVAGRSKRHSIAVIIIKV